MICAPITIQVVTYVISCELEGSTKGEQKTDGIAISTNLCVTVTPDTKIEQMKKTASTHLRTNVVCLNFVSTGCITIISLENERKSSKNGDSKLKSSVVPKEV